MLAPLSHVLPPARHVGTQPLFATETPAVTSRAVAVRGVRAVPPYGKRAAFMPRVAEDFGDGGAFPEIHVAQFPLDMGKARQQQTVQLSMDAEGKIKYDAVITQGSGQKMFTRYQDLVPKDPGTEGDLSRPDPETELQNTLRTRQALEKITHGKIQAALPTCQLVSKCTKQAPPIYTKYTPATGGAGHNSGAKSRIIQINELQKDPLEPAKFKHKKAPPAPPSPPAPVLRSPPRKLTSKDQADWKIAPCISNWKNAKGHTIPLDKRLASSGRGLQEMQMNNNFAKLSEALITAQRNARQEVVIHAALYKQRAMKENESKEKALRDLAARTRDERAGLAVGKVDVPVDETPEERKLRLERDAQREDRKREREYERRQEARLGKKAKLARDRDRDISEKIALGQGVGAPTGDSLYDQRLFNQTEGMDSGFGDEEEYNVYDRSLFTGGTVGQIYKPKRGDDEVYGEADMEKLKKIDSRFQPDKGFAGAENPSRESRSGPVQFERVRDEPADPFNLDSILSSEKSGSKSRHH